MIQPDIIMNDVFDVDELIKSTYDVYILYNYKFRAKKSSVADMVNGYIMNTIPDHKMKGILKIKTNCFSDKLQIFMHEDTELYNAIMNEVQSISSFLCLYDTLLEQKNMIKDSFVRVEDVYEPLNKISYDVFSLKKNIEEKIKTLKTYKRNI